MSDQIFANDCLRLFGISAGACVVAYMLDRVFSLLLFTMPTLGKAVFGAGAFYCFVSLNACVCVYVCVCACGKEEIHVLLFLVSFFFVNGLASCHEPSASACLLFVCLHCLVSWGLCVHVVFSGLLQMKAKHHFLQHIKETHNVQSIAEWIEGNFLDIASTILDGTESVEVPADFAPAAMPFCPGYCMLHADIQREGETPTPTRAHTHVFTDMHTHMHTHCCCLKGWPFCHFQVPLLDQPRKSMCSV